MRVIAGKVKGMRLRVPGSARPATDRVRGAIFSMMAGQVEGSRVLDLYAGSGALGIEALSRGAVWADFVEQQPRSCATIRENLKQTGLSGLARVYCSPVQRALSQLPGEYDLVVMDPPYAYPSLESLVEEVALSGRLRPGGFLVIPHSSRLSSPPSSDGLSLIKQRRHGDTCISVYRKGDSG